MVAFEFVVRKGKVFCSLSFLLSRSFPKSNSENSVEQLHPDSVAYSVVWNSMFSSTERVEGVPAGLSPDRVATTRKLAGLISTE
jgi:hypothetical protein